MKLPALVLCFIQHLKAETSQVTIVQLLERSQSQDTISWYFTGFCKFNMFGNVFKSFNGASKRRMSSLGLSESILAFIILT
ncbi:hypothetical protein BDE02_07G066300 [Populus trichocarpa]|nr:hypothetical protein BDE02_07G066300 [Populus trichocarpa]